MSGLTGRQLILLKAAMSGRDLLAHARNAPELQPLLSFVGDHARLTDVLKRAAKELQSRRKFKRSASFYPLVVLTNLLKWDLDRRQGHLPTVGLGMASGGSELLPDVAVAELFAAFSIQAHYLGLHQEAAELAFDAAWEHGVAAR